MSGLGSASQQTAQQAIPAGRVCCATDAASGEVCLLLQTRAGSTGAIYSSRFRYAHNLRLHSLVPWIDVIDCHGRVRQSSFGLLEPLDIAITHAVCEAHNCQNRYCSTAISGRWRCPDFAPRENTTEGLARTAQESLSILSVRGQGDRCELH